MIPIYIAIYVAIGLAFVGLRIMLIKRDCIWSVVALIDFVDGYLMDNAEKQALRNNYWLWLVWPPFVLLELMLGFVLGLMITVMGGWRDILFGDKELPDQEYERDIVVS